MTTGSPQLEHGFLRIANELLEALMRLKCSGNQKNLLLAIIRETYGRRGEDGESLTEAALDIGTLAEMVGCHRVQAATDIKRLIARNIVHEVKRPSYGRARILRLNKRYLEWIEEHQAANKSAPVVSDTTNKQRPIVSETTDKQKSKRKRRTSRVVIDPVDYEHAELLRAQIDLVDPGYLDRATTKYDRERWANEFRLIRAADKRAVEDIRFIIEHFIEHGDAQFSWRDNIRSPGALRGRTRSGRDKFLTILSQLKNEGRNGKRTRDSRLRTGAATKAHEFTEGLRDDLGY